MALRALRIGILVCAPLALGCGAVASIGAILAQPIVSLFPEEPPPFEDALTAFNNDMRWGRVRQAVAQVEREQQVKFLELFENEAAPWQFTSVDVVTSDPKKFTADGDGRPIEIDALVSYEFYRPPMVTQEKIRQHQVWRYVLLERRWVLDFDFAPFEAKDPTPAAAAPEP